MLGYAAVCQDLRGRYASQGVNQMLRDDGRGLEAGGTRTARRLVRLP